MNETSQEQHSRDVRRSMIMVVVLAGLLVGLYYGIGRSGNFDSLAHRLYQLLIR